MSGMIGGLPLMKADDGTGASGTRPERQLSAPTRPLGAPFHDIGEAVAAKRSPLASQTSLSHDQPRRGISLGESQLNTHTQAGHVVAVSKVLAAFAKTVRNAAKEAAEIGDDDTADMITDISRATDKNLWSVEAHVERDAG
jgi:DNA-binding ferritin-like protein